MPVLTNPVGTDLSTVLHTCTIPGTGTLAISDTVVLYERSCRFYRFFVV